MTDRTGIRVVRTAYKRPWRRWVAWTSTPTTVRHAYAWTRAQAFTRLVSQAVTHPRPEWNAEWNDAP